ncbi:MAG TPA: hypothetical protein VII56_09565 [Rhizomicrobium sp.]
MRSRLFFTSVLLLLALAGPASARGTLDSILPDIRSAHPGRLSDAEPWTDSEGRTHYKIKWLTPEGRILYFNADADSGRYTSSSGDEGGQGWRDRNRSRGQDDSSSDDNERGHRSHWNDGDNGSGDWPGRHGGGNGNGGGDWRGGDPNRSHGGGDWRGGGHDGGHDWHDGRGGDPNGRGGNGGDNGGGHHHHGGN